MASTKLGKLKHLNDQQNKINKHLDFPPAILLQVFSTRFLNIHKVDTRSIPQVLTRGYVPSPTPYPGWVSFAQQAPKLHDCRASVHAHTTESTCPTHQTKLKFYQLHLGLFVFSMIYTCSIFAMLLLDFPHALLLATSKLISCMFPINALYTSCSWLFSLCLSCVVLLIVRQS